MAYLPAEELLVTVDHNVYKLVAVASIRAQELANGAPKLIDAPVGEKAATTALREISAGKVLLREFADKLAKESKKKA